MDRNFYPLCDNCLYSGQARKSLWIETHASPILSATTPGQARKSLWIETEVIGINAAKYAGQARKSLWIETSMSTIVFAGASRSGS